MDGVRSLMVGVETKYWDAESLRIDEERVNLGGRVGHGWVVYAKVRRGERRNKEQVNCRLKGTCCTRLKNKEESRNKNYK